MVPSAGATRAACRLEVRGTVQGVGFRPFVFRLAQALGLDGSVRNAGGYVVVEAAGPDAAVAELTRRLRADAPPRARVTTITVSGVDGSGPAPGTGFAVAGSAAASAADLAGDLPPDLACCPACRRELFDPADRRYRYPFVNCTDCGPRATIVDDLPYDRARTGMRAFPLCPACAAEYADPADRRFHAEPVACPDCGPRLSWCDTAAPPLAAPAGGAPTGGAPTGGAPTGGAPTGGAPGGPPGAVLGEAALQAAVAAVRAGRIVAVKGLGGYQLVCDATAPATVALLRTRKHRPAKPFAVMVADLTAARALAEVDDVAALVLTGPARPVLLLPARPAAGTGAPLAAAVHPGTGEVGLFLPTTPLHHLLLAELARPLVVTSGNRADEPIAIDDADARGRLAGVADGFLSHDRPIRSRYDDSVSRVVGGRERLVRRARGYAPAPLLLPVPAGRPLLAVGAQLKHTFTIAAGDRALVGPHGGDLSDLDTFDAFTRSLAHLSRLYRVQPEAVAHDLHPRYLSTQYARRWPAGRRIAVQHHHAHVASCAAEHGITEPFLGVAYDGLGLGDDGTLWGGEVLAADLRSYRRVGRFARAPLPGGEAAVRHPVRMALGYLYGGETGPIEPALAQTFTGRLDAGTVRVLRRMIEHRVQSPPASSAGRLFDAAAAILGLCEQVSYEGEAAVALESAARAAGPGGPAELPWRLTTVDGLAVYDPAPTLAALLAGAAAGAPAGPLAAGFHQTLAAVTVALCEQARGATGRSVVCLSGGVFQNALLTELVTGGLAGAGFAVFGNEQVPANDGGISFGQAAVAAARMG